MELVSVEAGGDRGGAGEAFHVNGVMIAQSFCNFCIFM